MCHWPNGTNLYWMEQRKHLFTSKYLKELNNGYKKEG